MNHVPHGRGRQWGPWVGFPLVMQQHDILSASEVAVFDDVTGALRLFGFTGHDKAGDPLAKIVVDLPERYIPTIRLSSSRRSDQELRDVLAFLASAYGDRFSAADLRPGPDPNASPDVLVHTEKADFGVETTQLIMPSAKAGNNAQSKWSQFERVTDWLISNSSRLTSAASRNVGGVIGSA